MSVAIEKARKTFAKNLKYYLDLRGKTQKDLVEYLGVSKGAVSQWVNGNRSMSAETGNRIAEFLNVSIDLLNEEHKEISDNQLKVLLFGTDNISDKKLNQVLAYAKFIKEQ